MVTLAFGDVAVANHRILCHYNMVRTAAGYVNNDLGGCIERGLGSTLEPSGALGATDPDVLQLNPGGVALVRNRVLDYGTDKLGDESPAADQQNGATSDLAKVRALFNSGADGGAVGSRINSVFLDSTITHDSSVAAPAWNAQYYTGGSFGQREGVPGGSVNPPVTGGKNQMFPGFTSLFAWFGYYSDKNGDGTIDDAEDPGGPSRSAWPPTSTATNCITQGHADKRSVMNARDDFFWIGGKRRNLLYSSTPDSTAPQVGMHLWMWPGEHPYYDSGRFDNEIHDPVLGYGVDWADKSEEYFGYTPDGLFDDRTDVCNGFAGGVPVHQGWFSGSGFSISNDDNSLLERTWTVTTVNAPEAPLSRWTKDIPNAAFIDIDEYDTLDDGVATTWYAAVISNVRTVWQQRGQTVIAEEAVTDQTCQKSDLVPTTDANLLGYIPTLDPGWAPGNVMDLWPSKCNADLALDSVDLADRIQVQLLGPTTGASAYPIYWHEPNQPGDVYPAIVNDGPFDGALFADDGQCREGVGVRQLDGGFLGCRYNFTAYRQGKTLWIDTKVFHYIAGCSGNPFGCVIVDDVHPNDNGGLDLRPHSTASNELWDWKDKRAWNVDGRPIWLLGFVGYWHDLNRDGWISRSPPTPTWDCDMTLTTRESYYACGSIADPHAEPGDTDEFPLGEDEVSGGAECARPSVIHVAVHPFRGGALMTSWPGGTMVQRNAATFGDSISDVVAGKPIFGFSPAGSPSNGAFFNPVVAPNAIDTNPATGDSNPENDLDVNCSLESNYWSNFGRVLWPAPGGTDYSIRITTTFTKDPDGNGPLPAVTLVDVDCLYGLQDTLPPPGCDFANGE